MSTLAFQPDVELCLSARAENVAVVRQALRELGHDLGLEPEVTDDLVLAASEACSNVVMHAYPADGEGLLHVHVIAEEDAVAVMVRDHGGGRGTAGPGLGVGLAIIAAIAESLEVRNDDAWREVHMTFPRGHRDREPTGGGLSFAA